MNEKYTDKSIISAGIMQLFAGCFGLGRFYLGDTKIGVLQIIVSIATFGVGGVIWGIVDGIKMLSSNTKY